MADAYISLYITVRSFIRHTLFIYLYLLSFAVPQWMLLSICTTADHILYTLICFSGSFVLLTLIHLVESVKYNWPWNWLAIGSCYELMTLGVGAFVMNSEQNTVMMAVAMALLIFGLVLVLCFFIISGYNYPNPYKLASLAALGLILVICAMILGTYRGRHWMDVALLLFMLSVLLLMISYVLISFKNLDVLIKPDTLLLGFVLYINYVLVLVASFICIQRCDFNFDATNVVQKASPYG
ncbi:uncharacterized protein LOC117564601 [Drosophila albomicans]|uniref:Uncharacterized protein LOC117564601 n=1 Tax=Drosophila albomicans TaxID=7291 RepID=A0A6P8WJ94_DROAB|nr:uncharacterized protein LOC117564601 [Drosophila albomicans]